MQLRDYQTKFVGDLSTALALGKRKIIGQLPTGGGKTVVFSAITKRYIDKSDKSVLILVHRKELLQQTRKTLYNHFGVAAHPIIAGTKWIPKERAYVGMVETVSRRVSKLSNIGLVIIDEAHISAFNKLHAHFPDQYIIGVTATPLSASKKNPIKNHYEDIVCSLDIPQLIQRGFLAQNITIAPKEVVDRAELAVKGGDFREDFMAEKFSNKKYIQSTLHAYEKHLLGQKTMIFNVTVEHSLKVAEAFKEAGYNVRHIDGGSSKYDRNAALAWLRDTPDAVLCNVGVYTTGFDEPTLLGIIVNRATMSLPLWLQMTGRGGRIVPNEKDAFTIIDMGGNAITHGDWCDERDWAKIFHNPPKPGAGGAAPVKSCPNCDAIIPAGSKSCKYCGYEYPPDELNQEEGVMRDFVVLTKNINVQELIERNKDKAHYYPFFYICKQVARDVKATMKKIEEDKLPKILESLHKVCKEWCKENKKRYNDWHRTRAEQTFYLELTKLYKSFQSPIELEPEYKKPEQESTTPPQSFAPDQTFMNITL